VKRQEHQAETCQQCQPAWRAAWTAGQLMAALATVPDDTPLVVNAVDPIEPDLRDPQVIVGAGFGKVGSGDGHGLDQSTTFGLDCAILEGQLEIWPDRLPRWLNPHREPRPGARAEPEAGS
jgi:hypothetical protein